MSASAWSAVVPSPPPAPAAHTPGRSAERPGAGSSERILGAVAYAARQLLRSRDPDAAIDDVLAELGAATGVGRVHVSEVVERATEVVARRRWAWAAPGVEPRLGDARLHATPLRAGTWAALSRGEPIRGHAEDLPDDLRALLGSPDVVSVAVVPIHQDDQLWGVIGFDECHHPRAWSDPEMAGLQAAGDVFAGALEQDAARRALQATARAHVAATDRERQATDRLRALDGLKDEFLEAVSHELRTPLTSVVGFAETLQRISAVDPAGRGAAVLAGLLSNAERLRQLLENLLDLGHLSRGGLLADRADVDVRAVVDTVVTPLDRALGGRDVELDIRVATANVDRDKLERILTNLLLNAARHTGDDVAVAVRAWHADGALHLAVEDAGGGIPDAYKIAVFEPFRHGPDVARHAPGTGVGLSVVARYALVHGGSTWIEDRPGGGTIVRVVLDEDVPTAG